MSRIQTDKHDRLFYEQVRLLYREVPNSLLANLVGTFIALLVYTGEVESLRLVIWVALLLIMTIAQYLNYFACQLRDPGPLPQQTRYWYQRFMLSCGLVALAVGSAGYFLLVLDNITLQVTLALMIVCLASFATTTLSPRLEIVLPFLVLVFVPVMVTLYSIGTELTTYVFWMMLVLLLLLCLGAMRMNATITRIFELNIEAEQREEALRNSQQRLSLYVQSTPLAVIEWNLEHEVVAWNPAAASIFNYSQQEAIGRKAIDLIIPPGGEEHALETWRELLDNTGAYHLITENCRKDGSLLFCEWFNTPLIDNQDKVIGVVSLGQDISLEIENEKVKKEFVSIVSHELRTPVTSIKGSLALLASGVLQHDPQKSEEMLRIALQNSDRLQLLLGDILDVEKLDSGKVDYNFRVVDLNELLPEVVNSNQPYAGKYQIQVEIAEVPQACLVRVDPNRLMQVLTNLLSNAIKFSEKSGTVRLSVAAAGENMFRVAVNNRGDIIPESDRKRMFSKFFQRDSSDKRSKDGSGLGLYISQKILDKHGSQLDFASNKETGTTFYFDLCRADTADNKSDNAH